MELFALHEQTKYTQIKQQESLDLLSNKFDELEREHKKKKKEKIIEFEAKTVYSWRNCLNLHAVKENTNENT